jgi:hypothetical protein
MSSHNAAVASSASAAAAAPPSRSKSAAPLCGFDIISKRLLAAFHAATPTTSETAGGVLNNAMRALKTSFTGSQGNVQGSKKRDISNLAPAVTPAISSTRSSLRTRPTHMPSPIKFPTLDDMADNPPHDQPPDIMNIERLDQVFVPISSASRGCRRLRLAEVLRLASKDECIIFIPPPKKNSAPQ